MARLDALRKINAELYQLAPDWGRRLFDVLNPFMEQTFGALQKQLTFPENFAGAVREFSFETRSNYSSGATGWEAIRFATGLRTKAIGVNLLQINEVADDDPVITSAVTLNWVEVDGDIVVRYVAGLANDKKYYMRVHAF